MATLLQGYCDQYWGVSIPEGFLFSYNITGLYSCNLALIPGLVPAQGRGSTIEGFHCTLSTMQ